MTWNDGALLYGARKLKIFAMTAGTGGSGSGSTWAGSARATYVSETISVTLDSKVTEQFSEAGVPNGAFGVDGAKTGSTVIQIPLVADEVTTGDAFTIKLDGNNAESFVITSAGHPEEQLGARKQPISFRKLYVATGPAWDAAAP